MLPLRQVVNVLAAPAVLFIQLFQLGGVLAEGAATFQQIFLILLGAFYNQAYARYLKVPLSHAIPPLSPEIPRQLVHIPDRLWLLGPSPALFRPLLAADPLPQLAIQQRGGGVPVFFPRPVQILIGGVQRGMPVVPLILAAAAQAFPGCSRRVLVRISWVTATASL
ncbi:hypothetical protein SDC9_144552 [bioreactor metagenome]|uniref:Uncharacterized protein n=1 Tax=bioreactor metagenome TaxID=1076179 RepID=A0A645E777_9ZZZZ